MTREDVSEVAFAAMMKEQKPQTNADHIRSMTDDELALLFGAFCATAECRSADGAVCPFRADCPLDRFGSNLWLEWLQDSYKEDT